MSTDTESLSNREKLTALRPVVEYGPAFTFELVCFGAVVAFLEGIRLSFIYPIIETA